MDMANTVMAFQDRAERKAERIAESAFRNEQRDVQAKEHAEDRAFTIGQRKETQAENWTKETVSRGMLQNGAGYKPDETITQDPRYRARAHLQITSQGLRSVLNSDDFKTKQMQNDAKRAEATKQVLTSRFSKAWGTYQVDKNQGMLEMLSLYDEVNDGLEIVKDSAGNPIIDAQKGTLRIKNRKGSFADIPMPSMDEMYRMGQTMLLEGGLEKAAPGWEKNRRAHNLSQIMNGTYYSNADGRMVVRYNDLVDPEDHKTTITKIMDIDTNEELTPREFGRGGFTEVDMKGKKPQNRSDKLTTLKKDLELALMPFGKGTPQLTKDVYNNGTWEKVITQEAQTAFQEALAIVQKSKGSNTPPQNLTEQKLLNSAMKAVKLYDEYLHTEEEMQNLPPGGSNTQQTSRSVQTGMQQPAGNLPQGLTEQDIQFNMQKYGKTRGEVVAQFQRMNQRR